LEQIRPKKQKVTKRASNYFKVRLEKSSPIEQRGVSTFFTNHGPFFFLSKLSGQHHSNEKVFKFRRVVLEMYSTSEGMRTSAEINCRLPAPFGADVKSHSPESKKKHHLRDVGPKI
jgi:hypothetical protein